MNTTADVAYRTSRVQHLGQIIYVTDKTRELNTIRPPFFVHRSPSNDRGMVTVTDNLLTPLCHEVTSNLRIIGIHTPRWSFTPRDITHLVCPIEETLFKYLLVQTGTIETGLHREFNIVAQCLIRRSSPDTVRIESLVQYQALVEGFVVQVHLVTIYMHFAHTGIRGYLINHLTLCILHLIRQIVQEGIFRTPQFRRLDRKYHDAVVLCLDTLGCNHLIAILQRDRQCGSCFAIESGMNHDLLLIDISNHL